MFQAGQKIGVYTLIRRIGRGGFGEVWFAERRMKFVTTKVALKLPHDSQVDHEAIKQEAVLWEQASGHPNVLPIIEAEEYDGQIVIVSEYAPDGSLDELLKTNGGALPIKRAVEMTIGILNGLEFLHSRKIIHRDLKPANILLQGEMPRLADFGVSRAMRTTSSVSIVAGTPYYMSPEAFDGKRNVTTDIWSIGVMLYEMLTGSVPFNRNSFGELINAITNHEPAPPSDSVPAALQKIVSKAMAKQPAERYQTAREMRDELVEYLLTVSQRERVPEIVQLVETPEPETVQFVETPKPEIVESVEIPKPETVQYGETAPYIKIDKPETLPNKPQTLENKPETLPNPKSETTSREKRLFMGTAILALISLAVGGLIFFQSQNQPAANLRESPAVNPAPSIVVNADSNLINANSSTDFPLNANDNAAGGNRQTANSKPKPSPENNGGTTNASAGNNAANTNRPPENTNAPSNNSPTNVRPNFNRRPNFNLRLPANSVNLRVNRPILINRPIRRIP